MYRRLTMIALAASLAACADGTGTDTGAGTSAAMSGSSDAAAAVADPALDTDEQRTLYALGVALGRNVGEFELTESELEIVSMGLRIP